MSRPTRWQRFSWLTALALFALLLALASFQYRWTGELSRAERERMRSGLQSAATLFATDFNRELTRAFIHFQPLAADERSDLASGYARALAGWRESAPYPELVAAIWLASREQGSVALSRLDEETGGFLAAAPPPALDPLLRRLESEEIPPMFPRLRGESPPDFPFLAPAVPALIFPVIDRSRLAHGPETGRQRSTFAGVIVVQLDLEFLGSELLPLLARTYFASDGRRDYELAVMVDDGSGRTVYSSNESLPADYFAVADQEMELFNLADREELRKLWLEMRSPAALGEPALWRGPRQRDEPWGMGRRLRSHLPRLAEGEAAGGWRLVVRHRQGSLETAVTRIRHRNLTVSFGILSLLALTVVVLLVSSRRAQRLAQQQVEFVAGVSHELRTPLAGVGSLAQNLEDGIVTGSEQMRSYGTMIRRETERLTRMVDQALAFSGSLSDRSLYDLEPVAMAEIVSEAVEECRKPVEESGYQLELSIPNELPPLLADRGALQQAICNLIHNAAKHSGGGERVRVAVEAVDGSRGVELAIRVIDRGQGIPGEDLPHVFEPFYRGRNASEAQTEGSGLGLSLVRQIVEGHGGRVEVESKPGEGSTFSLCLPALSEEHDARTDSAG